MDKIKCDVRDALLHDGARLGPGNRVDLDPRTAARLEAAGVVARASIAASPSKTPALEGAAGPAGGAIPGTNTRETDSQLRAEAKSEPAPRPTRTRRASRAKE